MKKTIFFYVLLGCLIAWPINLQAATYEIDVAHSSVEFKIKHLVSKVKGGFSEFSGTIEYDEVSGAGSVTATIKVASIDTRNEKRDEHLRGADFFDVAQFPDITFTGQTESGDAATGTLTMHGVSKEITMDLDFHGIADDPWGKRRAGFSGETTINRKDFGMEYNKVLDQGGFLLGETVEIEIEIEAILKS